MNHIEYALLETLKDISAYTPYRLADFAQSGVPDDLGSPGAQLLANTRDAFVGQVEYLKDQLHSTYDLSDSIFEIAGNGPSVYTHTVWSEFLDLCAYQELGEDEEDTTEVPENSSDLAARCLVVQLRRMLTELAEQVIDAVTRDEEEAANEEDEEEDEEE